MQGERKRKRKGNEKGYPQICDDMTMRWQNFYSLLLFQFILYMSSVHLFISIKGIIIMMMMKLGGPETLFNLKAFTIDKIHWCKNPMNNIIRIECPG